MQDFWLHSPTKVVFGAGVVDEIGDVAKSFGGRALFVFGQHSIRSSGLYDRVKEKLDRAGVEICEHGGVRPNPRLSHVREGVEKARKQRVNAILAVGGGSVIDSSKAIAAGALEERDIWSFFTDGGKPTKALPIIAVPTVAATGSEMNQGVALTREETGEKLTIGAPCLYPQVSLLDPTLTFSVPRQYTAYGIADAFTHVLEPYLNGPDPDTPVQDHLAEGLLISLMQISRRLLDSLEDYNARADMMWASVLAHNGFLSFGRGRVLYEAHVLAHVVGGLVDAPHAATLTAVIPAWLTYSARKKRSRLSRFARRVMGVSGGDDNAVIAGGIQKLNEWFVYLGCPVSLSALGIKQADVAALVASAAPVALAGGMADVTEEDLWEIYKACLEV